MKKLTLLTTATVCLICSTAFGMQEQQENQKQVPQQIAKEPRLNSSGYMPLHNEGELDEILTAETVARVVPYNNVEPKSVVITNAGKGSRRLSQKIKGALSLNYHGEKSDIQVNVDVQKLNAALQNKPSLLSRFTDPVTVATALTTGVLVYYFAKNSGE